MAEIFLFSNVNKIPDDRYLFSIMSFSDRKLWLEFFDNFVPKDIASILLDFVCKDASLSTLGMFVEVSGPDERFWPAVIAACYPEYGLLKVRLMFCECDGWSLGKYSFVHIDEQPLITPIFNTLRISTSNFWYACQHFE